MRSPTIERFMTRGVRTIGLDVPLARAHVEMNEHGIRHLAVLDGGKLVGLLSQRDLHLIETLDDVDPAEVKVEEAMTQDVLTIEAGATLNDVAHEMRRRRVGSALVIRAGKPEGIFTTTDALRAIEELTGGAPRRTRTRPAATRSAAGKATSTRRRR